MFSLSLSIVVLLSTLAVAAIPNPVIKISFHRKTAPKLYTKFSPSHVSPSDAKYYHFGLTVPPPYRALVSRWRGFSYALSEAHNLPPAHYRIVLGLVQKNPCLIDGRVFKFQVGNVTSPDIDIFKSVGCGKIFDVHLNVDASDGKPLVLRALPVRNAGPLLANIRVFRSSTPPPNLTPLPTSARLVFSKFGKPPAGFKRFNADRISPNSFSLATSKLSPRAYQHHVRRRPFFSYVLPIRNGNYSVRLGFMDFGQVGCNPGKRVFRATANGRTSVMAQRIDVYSRVGCGKPYDVYIRDVPVKNSLLNLTFTSLKDKGAAPTLAHQVLWGANRSSGRGTGLHLPLCALWP